MRAAAVTLVLVWASCSPVGAAVERDPARIPAGTYVLDPDHASVVAAVNHQGFSNYVVRFNRIEATLEYDPARPTAARLTAVIDPRSVDSGNAGLDRQLAGRNFLDAERHPLIRFVAREIRPGSDGRGQVVGDLTLHGVTRPVTLEVVFNGTGRNVLLRRTVGFSATASISRSAFGLTSYQNLVGDAVALRIEAEFNSR